MRYQRTARFLADYVRLSPRERVLFKKTVGALNDAFAQQGRRFPARWPARLRVKAVAGAEGIWDLTWSFAGPDGRATFEIVDLEGEPAILWRRIGGHEILREP